MLSIIVSSRDLKLFSQLSSNISQTVGCEYEVIKIDNINYFGICEAYNLGVSKSKFSNICFVHEDVLFHTKNWGNEICDILTDNRIGLVGVAGQTYRSKVPSTWHSFYAPNNTKAINIIQHNKNGVNLENVKFEISTTSEVVNCDGVFLCTRKDVLAKFPFDQKTFKNFHFYDVDFCLTIIQEYKIVVTYNVLLEHFSRGVLNAKWIGEASIFYNKWGNLLPLYLNNYSNKEVAAIEKKNNKELFKFTFGHLYFKAFILLFKVVPINQIIEFFIEKVIDKCFKSKLNNM